VKTRFRLLLPLLLLASTRLPMAGSEPSQKPTYSRDPSSGLLMAPDWELVRNNCIMCHSMMIVVAQRGTRTRWERTLEWMRTQAGMPELSPDVAHRILRYLEVHQAPIAVGRRRPIPPDLMPPNPYASQ